MTKEKEQRYGAKKLTREEILKLPVMERRPYMGTLSPEEKNEILIGSFINNLNDNTGNQTN